MKRISVLAIVALTAHCTVHGFSLSTTPSTIKHGSISTWSRRILLQSSNSNNDDDEEAAAWRARAEELREQVRKLEESFGDRPRRPTQPTQPTSPPPPPVEDDEGPTLRNKTVLVVGANGRLGSMVCRYLLRNFPNTQVVAAVHYVGENSSTSRGYGRLSYEVGAEDGVGTLNPAWDLEDRNARFEFRDEMKDYNLQNLRVVEVELLDPVQCETICEGVDAAIFCATDFNGNKPRAVSGLNVAFLFRALADPTKGRVEVEGVRNILGGLKSSLQSRSWNNRRQQGNNAVVRAAQDEGGGSTNTVDDYSQPTTLTGPSDPTSFVLVSTAPGAYKDFETPFGTFNGLKREGEDICLKEFPSLTATALQINKYEDNFVEEDLDIILATESSTRDNSSEEEALSLPTSEGDIKAGTSRRRINRRDAAKVAVDALLKEEWIGKRVELWTAER